MLTLKEAAARYLDQLKARNFSPATLEGYTRYLRDLIDILQHRDRHMAASVESSDLESWTIMLHKRGLSIRTRIIHVGLVKRFFAWLKERGDILSDPAMNLEQPREPGSLSPVPPDADAMRRLLDTMPAVTPQNLRDRAFVEILYACMLRLSEALNLDLNDIDLDGQTVLVRKGKGGKDRVVPLPSMTCETLDQYLHVRDQVSGRHELKGADRQALFIARGVRLRIGLAHLIFTRLKEESGLAALYPHLLRHAGAVHMLRGKADIRHVQEILGHRSLETTRDYLRLVPNELKCIYDDSFPNLKV